MNNAGRIGFLIKGDYSDTDTYDFLDVVFYGGASYVAKKATIGNPPARSNEYWQILAESGGMTEDANISDTTVTFEVQETRANIFSGDKMSTAFGKIAKWFSDILNGAGSTLLGTNLTQGRVLLSDASGKVSVSSITSTILGFLSGLKSNVQEQLNSKIDSSKIVQSTNITEEGFIIDGKILSEELAELDGVIDSDMNRYNSFKYIYPTSGVFTDIIDVDTTSARGIKNKNYVVYQDSNRGWFENMPKKVTEKSFVGWREILWRDANYYAIRLTETYPIDGRVWFKRHSSNGWGNWGCISGGPDHTILSVTVKGLNIRVYGNTQRAFMWIYGTTTEELATKGAVVTLTNISDKNYHPRNSHIMYTWVGAYRLQVQYTGAGNINLGYSMKCTDGVGYNLPSGSGVYFFGAVAFEEGA